MHEDLTADDPASKIVVLQGKSLKGSLLPVSFLRMRPLLERSFPKQVD